MRDLFIKEVFHAALKDPRVVIITGDLGFKVFDEFREQLPKQFINAGVAEQNMVGIATGMALEGYTVFAYSIANFATLRCLEQIRNDVCYHNANVKIVSIGAGFSYGALGISHHATEDISIMRSLPDITICSPGCDWEVVECTKALLAMPGPAYLRLDRASAGNTRQANEVFKLGKTRIVRPGQNFTLVVTGGILEQALLAADELVKAGIQARVISVPTIKPFDVELVIDAAKTTAGLITIEEHTIDGGLGSMVAEMLLESGSTPGFFKRMGLKSEFSSVVGSQNYLREHYSISSKHIVEQARQLISSEMKIPNISRASNL